MNEKKASDIYWRVFFVILAIALTIFSLLALIGASRILNFDNSLVSENLTFTGNQNITRYVNLSLFSNVTTAYINLSGIYTAECYQEFANQSTSCGGLSNGSYTTSGNWFYNNPSFLYDGDWSTFDYSTSAFPNPSSMYSTYYKPAGANNRSVWQTNGSNGINNYSFSNGGNTDYCWNAYSDRIVLWSLSIKTAYVGWYCYSGGGGGANYQGFSAVNAPPYSISEEEMIWNMSDYFVTNTSLNVGNISNNWYFAGNFTQMNNKTLDLASAFNVALNNGSCDCQGCIRDSSNCSIPLIFHSDTAGILQVSDINVTYTNIPTLNLSLPLNASTTASIKPSFNWTYYKNIENIRYNYSLQIANDTSFKTIVINKTLTVENYTLSNTGGENLSQGVWYWRVNTTDGTTMRYSENFTLTVDVNTLAATIYQPIGDQGSKDVTFSLIIDNSSVISSCFYYVNFSTGTYVISQNTSINCNAPLITGSFTVPFETSYIFYFSANNSNTTQVRAYSSSNFNIPLPGTPGGGGGGGGGSYIDLKDWIASPLMIDKYFLYLPSYNQTKKTQIEVTSNIKITSCFSSSSNTCQIVEGNKAIITISVPNPGNFLLSEQNLSVKMMNDYGQIKEVKGQLRIINLGFYLPTNEISLTDDEFYSNPYIFAIKDNQMVGIRMYIVIIGLLFIAAAIRYVSR